MFQGRGESISSNPITASNPGSGTFQFAISSTDNGDATYSTPYTVTVNTTGSASGDATEIAAKINAAGVQNVSASVDASNRIVITHALGRN